MQAQICFHPKWVLVTWMHHPLWYKRLHSFVEALKMEESAYSMLSPLSFSVYSPDMPSRLPIQDICAGLLTSVGTAIRYWFHYTLVAFAWLGVVPLTACRYQGWCSRIKHWMCTICHVLDVCNWFVCRSYLQVSVYWLCELTLDAAAGHALHVSGNTAFQHSSKALDSVLTYKCVDFCAFAERTCLQIAYRAASLSRAPCVHLSAWCGWENR